MNSHITLKGCRQNNLKNISLSLPKGCITVITGVSGSGKSSLAFDTLFAEGQRRFLEYLSPQTRQLIRQLPKPQVDIIEGLSPTLAVQQNRHAMPPFSTVATHTDLYDFLCLLYARIGEQYSPSTGQKLTRFTRQEIVEHIVRYEEGTRLQLLAPVSIQREGIEAVVLRLQKMGYLRLRIDGQDFEAGEEIPPSGDATTLDVVVDRIIAKEGIRERVSGSVETALDLSHGIVKVLEGREEKIVYFTEVFLSPDTGATFDPLEPADFNYLSPKGACPQCHGRGGHDTFDPDSFVFEEQEPTSDQIADILESLPKGKAHLYHLVWSAFSAAQNIHEDALPSECDIDAIIYGTHEQVDITADASDGPRQIATHWKGIKTIVDEDLHERKARSSFHAEDFVIWQPCNLCHGAKLKPEALACRVKDKNIAELCSYTVEELLLELDSWIFEGSQNAIAVEILPEITSRLQFLQQVGLGYLQLDRPGKTLSEGEAQRVLLASQIGAQLSGIVYILDEPSRGLHRRDIGHLATVFDKLRSIGNSVIVVEHEPVLIAQADHIVEIGPGSGTHGGFVTFEGSYDTLLKSDCTTGLWISGREELPKPKKPRKSKSSLHIVNANLHNLKNITLDIPLGIMTGLCGVSGSGKSTLAIDVLANDIQRQSKTHVSNPELIERMQIIGQRPTGISPRSTPATYVGLMTPLRQLFAKTKLSRARGYTAARFSTNKKGGRCEACEGLGMIRVDMEFMPELYLTCEVCQGKRYNYETLQVLWEGLSIADILNLPVEDALKHFQNIPELARILELMQELGLDYLTLGQSFTTLSGGEIQRLKLISELARPNAVPTFYIMDEPCVGLHYSDVAKLAKILHRLVEAGHSVLVVEHHLMLLKQCDWIIEMGPEGGPQGGFVIFEGTPAQLAKANTPTGKVIH
ncbi:MAG: excinuclease ABC subunit UvrA [Chlamydiales bacterium]|nr:excinuclease ABC subunit UvrA [Chlamydiales bacterium]